MKLAPEGSKLKVKAVYQALLFPDTSLLPHFWFYTFLKNEVFIIKELMRLKKGVTDGCF